MGVPAGLVKTISTPRPCLLALGPCKVLVEECVDPFRVQNWNAVRCVSNTDEVRTGNAHGERAPAGDGSDAIVSRAHHECGKSLQLTQPLREIAGAYGRELLHHDGRLIGEIVAEDGC